MKWWALLLGIVIVVIIVLGDTYGLAPIYWMYDYPYGDKVGHFLLFGLLSMFAILAAFEEWPSASRAGLVLRIDAALMMLMALEELLQGLFPQRTASIWDVAAGYLGVALFTGIALVIARRRPSWPAQGTAK